MSQDLSYALQITVIGMGLVFAAILVLWGLMALLVRLTPDGAAPAEAEPATQATESDINDDQRRRAAAIAVSVALARQRQLPASSDSPPTSAWQAVHRARQLHQKGTRR